MEKTKEFKTLIIRDLDKHPELVKIMNEAMKESNLKTGQSVIEFIIRTYDSQNMQIESMIERIKKTKKESEETILKLQRQLQDANKAIYHFKQFQILTNEL